MRAAPVGASDVGQDLSLTRRYDRAARLWRDKMRALGYYDAYLGFLSEPGQRRGGVLRVIDAGAGTAAFAEAWVAVNGAPAQMILIDPSARMLALGETALARHGVRAESIAATVEAAGHIAPADEVLAAHLIEHADDPVALLRRLRGLVRPGGRLRLVVSKPHWCNALVWLKWRHRSYAPETLREILGRAGFRVDAEYAFPAGPPSRTSRAYVARPDR